MKAKFILIFVVTSFMLGKSFGENVVDGKNESIMKALKSNDIDVQIAGLLKIQKLLSNSKTDLDIKENLIKIVPFIVKCLKSSNLKLQYESTVTLAEIVKTMPEIIDVIVEYDAIPELIKLIKNQFTFEKTIEILATMITQKPDELREIYLNLEIIVPILTSFSPHDVSTFNADVRTILANLFEEKHRPKKSDINLLIPIWSKLIYEFDASTIIKTIETVGHLAKEDKDLEKYVIDKNVIYSMVQLINHHELYIHQFLTIGLFYVTKGSAEQIQHTFDSGLLKYFDTLLHHPDETVHLLAVILISNVINKNEEQYQAVFDTKYIPLIMEYFKSDETQKRQVASKFFTKAIIHGKTEHILRYFKMNVVCFLSKHLKEHENDKDDSWADRIEVILKSFQNIFDKIPKPLLKDVSLEIIKCGGNDVITRFVKQESSDEISQLAIKIIYEMGRAMNVLDENDALRKEL